MKRCADQDGLQETDLGVCYNSDFPHIVPQMPVQVDVLPDLVCYGRKRLQYCRAVRFAARTGVPGWTIEQSLPCFPRLESAKATWGDIQGATPEECVWSADPRRDGLS